MASAEAEGSELAIQVTLLAPPAAEGEKGGGEDGAEAGPGEEGAEGEGEGEGEGEKP